MDKPEPMPKWRIKKMGKYWIVGGEEPMGPYVTRAEAKEDLDGLKRSWDALQSDPKLGLVCTGNKRRRK